jgi:type I restriction-modification system DNA methylase subunit
MFAKRILEKAFQSLDDLEINQAFENLDDFKKSIENIRNIKEENYQYGFLNDFFVKGLGYTLNPQPNYNLTTEFKNETDSKKVDGAILKDNEPIAVIELKSTKTVSMDKITNQAFNYKNNHPTCKYIITSNFEKLRLYIEYSNDYIEFDLFRMKLEDFRLIYLILSKNSLFNDLPKKLKDESKVNQENIAKEFYKKYSILRLELFENIINLNQIDKNLALNLSQKLLDRFIFLFFAEDKGLINSKTTQNIINRYKTCWEERELYHFVKIIFRAFNIGNNRINIQSYNGGLFLDDDNLDNLKISDNILIDILKLSDYDFDSDIDVNILGHIFENSLDDLEKIRENILDDKFDIDKAKRKKDGIFYTPNYITEYIIRETVGKLCDEKKIFLKIDNFDNLDDITKLNKSDIDRFIEYKDFLTNLKIIDPACGSGAFLNQAYNYLYNEYKFTFDLLNKFASKEQNIFLNYEFDTAILENNLFGVDINIEAIEIAKLSLWLKTAKRGRKLTDLSKNIICANSLLNMPFNKNSFDIVVGNPPYVRHERIKEFKVELEKNYQVYNGTADLFVYFYELGYNLLKNNGLVGFICSNKFFRAKYGENLREFILSNMQIKTIVDFNGVKVFEGATVDSAITIFSKIKSNDNFQLVDKTLKNSIRITQSTLNRDSFSFCNSQEIDIKSKIESIGTALKDWNIKINYGIKTGFNEAFIIDKKKRDELVAKEPKSEEIIKPILRGRDIKRYSYEWAGLYLINSHNNPPIDIDSYPAIKEHLDKFYIELEKRTDKGISPYHLRSCAYYDVFTKEKIVYSEIVQEPQFYLNGGKFLYGEATTFIMTGESLKYLIVLLHSKLITFAFKKFYMGTELGNKGFRYKKAFIEQLPIPKISDIEQEPFINKANIMLELHKKLQDTKNDFLSELKLDKISQKLENFDELSIDEFLEEYIKTQKIKLDKAKLKKLKKDWLELFENDKKEVKEIKAIIKIHDDEIDKMVYKLYKLTDDEIEVVQNG